MPRAKRINDSNGNFYGIYMKCAGCGGHVLPIHGISDSPQVAGKHHWTFNGDYERPVLSPSILCKWTTPDPPITDANREQWLREPWPERKPQVCHSFVGCNGAEPGQIIYLGDCTHELAGQTIDLPEFLGPDDDL